MEIPRHEVRSGCAESLKDGGEVIGTAAEFCESVLHESESDDEAEGERCPACEATLKEGELRLVESCKFDAWLNMGLHRQM